MTITAENEANATSCALDRGLFEQRAKRGLCPAPAGGMLARCSLIVLARLRDLG